MNSDEKDKHIAALEKQVGELNVKVTALYDMLMKSDPMVASGATRAMRIMDVVNNWERGIWGVKWAVRAILTIGSIAGALTAVMAARGGFN